MITGVVYTLVGIKNKWLHIYISAAYLASLAVTVLILYVMNPPVSNAIQGAYVVAVVMTGLILGGGAIIFTEMTEGLGCLLGGFCFSMWLLVLQPGGLLTTTSGKAIFIASFTVAGFSTSFSHRTRPYGLIVLISFAGATTLILGIDCFSRAGLKEFWAYLWALNNNLFPLGATSYPLTRGMKVEIASIVIIFLAGVISQMKLWKIIKERRSQRAAERLNDERTNEQEEENVGRRIERANAEARGQWEAVYGDKDTTRSTIPSTRDSGVGDMDSQKKGPTSTVASVKEEENIEMADMSSTTPKTGAGLVMADKDGGPITVRVAPDIDHPPKLDRVEPPVVKSPILASPRNSTSQTPEEEKIWVIGNDGEARLERKASQRLSKRSSNGVPKIVPLPFKVPDEDFADDRSSVATFADEDATERKRRSRHLSAGSMILRKLSQRSHASLRSPRSPMSNRNSRNFTIGEGPSAEELVIPRGGIEDDGASSIAATMDGLSDDDELRSVRSSMHQAPDTTEVAEPAEGSEIVLPKDVEKPVLEPESTKHRSDQVTEDVKPESAAKEIVSEVPQNPTTSADPKPDLELVAPKLKKSASNVSAIESKPSSITKERLPAQLSRVVMSYRTNEWAKHLSQADAPDLEDLKLAEDVVEEQSSTPAEAAAPVKVEELQQTAETANLEQPSRSHSQLSAHQPAPIRSNSNPSRTTENPPVLERSDSTTSAYLTPPDGLNRTLSQQSLSSLKSASNPSIPRGFRSVSGHAISQPIVESPIEEQFSSQSNIPSGGKVSNPSVLYGTAGTLISKRDSMIRQKYASTATLSTPQNPSYRYPTSSQTTIPYHSGPTSRAQSDAGSTYNYSNTNAVLYDQDDDNMSLSARRELIRQSSLHNSNPNLPLPSHSTPSLPQPQIYDSHQPQRQFSGPSPIAREQQLASWRASVQSDLASHAPQRNAIERQSHLWAERLEVEKRKAEEERRRVLREGAFDERMRRGDMLGAHREALRRMQRGAELT